MKKGDKQEMLCRLLYELHTALVTAIDVLIPRCFSCALQEVKGPYRVRLNVNYKMEPNVKRKAFPFVVV